MDVGRVFLLVGWGDPHRLYSPARDPSQLGVSGESLRTGIPLSEKVHPGSKASGTDLP